MCLLFCGETISPYPISSQTVWKSEKAINVQEAVHAERGEPLI
jgi:hypothetical protein